MENIKIKINVPALAYCSAVSVELDGFKAIKISKEDAMRYSFADQRSSFNILQKKYAQDSQLLQEDEFYDGYIIFDNGVTKEIVYMKGAFKVEKDPNEIYRIPLIKNGITQSGIWHYIYESVDGGKMPGTFRKVFTLGTIPFEEFCIPKDAENIRQKLIKSAVEGISVEISEAEDSIIHKVLNNDYPKFIQKINDQVKNLRVNIDECNFDEYELFPCSWYQVQIIKLSKKQFMYFDIYDKEKSITSLINKYGSDNILEVGEHYDGYALLHDGQCNHLIRMNAHIETTYEENDKKKFYISYQTDKYGKIIGYAKKLWNFGIKEYEIFCSSDIAKTIRKKLIDAAISGKTIQITNDEADVITKVFGPFAKAIKISEIYEENKDH